jgi:hypothetical protein
MRTLLGSMGSLLLAIGLVLGVGTAIPRMALACSCVAPMAIEDYAVDENVIFAGQVVGQPDPGVRYAVENWFSGTEPSDTVRVAGDFEGGGMCGLGFTPAEGTRWVGIAWRPPTDDPLAELGANEELQVSICQPFLDLDTPEGQALFDEAVAAFGTGGGVDPSPDPASPESPAPVETVAPQVPATPAPTPAPTPEAPGGPSAETVSMIAVGGVIAVGVLVLVAVSLVGRRRPAG